MDRFGASLLAIFALRYVVMSSTNICDFKNHTSVESLGFQLVQWLMVMEEILREFHSLHGVWVRGLGRRETAGKKNFLA